LPRFCRPFIAIALLLTTGLGAQAAEPFAIRGIALGILLADFKIAPTPDRQRVQDARPVCSDARPAEPLAPAAEAALRLSAAESSAGFVRCSYLGPENGSLVPAGLVIAGAATQASFLFVPDAKGELRLAVVRAEGDSADYDRVKSALRQRYGMPQTVIRGFAHDAAGAKLIDETARWSNGVSQIEIDQRLETEDVNQMAIEYRHDALVEEADKRLKKSGAGEADLL
jgi:hypothetical protein